MVKIPPSSSGAKLSAPSPPRIHHQGAKPTCPFPNTFQRTIGHGPIYDLVLVKTFVGKNGFIVVNESAEEAIAGNGQNPMPLPEWSTLEIVALVQALGTFDRSEWCEMGTGRRNAVDCDSYTVHFNRNRLRADPSAPKYYVKFSFSANPKADSKLLVIRIHPSKY